MRNSTDIKQDVFVKHHACAKGLFLYSFIVKATDPPTDTVTPIQPIPNVSWEGWDIMMNNFQKYLTCSA